MKHIIRLTLCLSLIISHLHAEDLPKVAPAADVHAALIDGEGLGWRALGPDDFAPVNSAAGTWTWKDGVLHCPDKPVSVLRTGKQSTNGEVVVEGMHEKPAANSGVFMWVPPASIEKLTAAAKPGLPNGIEVQILDHGYTDMVKAK